MDHEMRYNARNSEKIAKSKPENLHRGVAGSGHSDDGKGRMAMTKAWQVTWQVRLSRVADCTVKRIAASRLRQEDGQILILWPFVFIVACAFAGLTIDLGSIYAEKWRLQSAVDSASLSGVESYTSNPSGSWSAAAESIGDTNGLVSSDYAYNSSDGISLASTSPPTVTVRVTHPTPTYFMRVFGIDTVPITVSATAQIASPPAFDYAIFANKSIQISSGTVDVQGSIHSNDTISVYGSQNSMYVSGNCESVGTGKYGYGFQCGGQMENGTAANVPMPVYPASNFEKLATTVVNSSNWSTYFPSSQGWAWGKSGLEFNGGSSGQGATVDGNYDIEGDFTINGDSANVDGNLYVQGNVKLDPSSFSATGTLLATGNIQVSTSTVTQDSSDFMAFYSTTGSIQVSVNQGNFYGTLYAPTGTIQMSLSSGKVYGSVVAQNIQDSAGGTNVTYDSRVQTEFPMTPRLIP